MSQTQVSTSIQAAKRYAELSQQLSLANPDALDNDTGVAVQAKFITPLDPVIETADGNRLPAVPVEEAHKINALKSKADGQEESLIKCTSQEKEKEKSRLSLLEKDVSAPDDSLDLALPPVTSHPLFPPLPLYGPPSLLRNAHCLFFRITSFFLSTGFLLVIVLGALFTSIPTVCDRVWFWLTFRDPDRTRPFYEEEHRRAAARQREAQKWQQSNKRSKTQHQYREKPDTLNNVSQDKFVPLEGGPDKLVCDARYYARRVGLEMEKFKVQTEDGFIIDLWHLYDPNKQQPHSENEKGDKGPNIFQNGLQNGENTPPQSKRYPVLLIHGLLQSAGAYCCNDDDSLAFYLHKAGYDVWLGNNRAGFRPQHTLLNYSDPRMWSWNIRQMGVMDLPAFISRVLSETGFHKLGLVAHSQGTTQTFVALAKGQRPGLGEKISVFCALAPAVYAGPLIGKMYFKFMKVISPAMFRIFFGIHAFIPLMMVMHGLLPAKLYGWMGYLVFGFLFNWTDRRWDKGIRDRFFQFAPVYVSSESMRWWLGRECFAKHKCILSTKEEDVQEDSSRDSSAKSSGPLGTTKETGQEKGTPWYDERAPPFAMWIAGSDGLVDGRRLLDRFEQGREPHVNVVRSKVIEEYEHLDVLWAIDSIEKVGSEVKQVIWQTMSKEDRQRCQSIDGVTDTPI
ncbi:hypothetical protein LTR64_004413 [Lithohypha guttulata]|uniref:uncharacterized protein n=1 Tax=Lithohypha guttulata TaxID=1690604 RepID=UPI002DE17482|nr:hypothetical protein LTR51_006291 [Lithohypha guttulata]